MFEHQISICILDFRSIMWHWRLQPLRCASGVYLNSVHVHFKQIGKDFFNMYSMGTFVSTRTFEIPSLEVFFYLWGAMFLNVYKMYIQYINFFQYTTVRSHLLQAIPQWFELKIYFLCMICIKQSSISALEQQGGVQLCSHYTDWRYCLDCHHKK